MKDAFSAATTMKFTLLLLFLSTLLLTSGCSKEPETGPGKIRWDRETCERCVMAVSDHYYSAQVRGGPAGKKTKLYKFDDIGCAMIWLDEQPWKDDPRTEVWVTDFRNGSWINAKKAAYIKGKKTPMDYGLGAQSEPADGALDYEQARAHVYEVEKRFNQPPPEHQHPASAPTHNP
jgi:nitrous oxide reductase accessory protein NosL